MSSVGGAAGGSRWDKEAVPGDPKASAKENLEAAGDDLKRAVTPDLLKRAIAYPATPGMDRILKNAVVVPAAFIADLVELPLRTGLAVKDGADAAIHGIVSLFRGKK